MYGVGSRRCIASVVHAAAGNCRPSEDGQQVPVGILSSLYVDKYKA